MSVSRRRRVPRPEVLAEARADLTRFGGAAGWRLPPPVGATLRWPAHEGRLLALVAACAADDRARAAALLSEGGAATSEPPAAEFCTERWSAPLGQRWWAGIGAFLSSRLRALECLGAVPAPERAVLLAEELSCRQRHDRELLLVPELLSRLAARGLRPVLIKGLALAHALHREPWARASGDVDLLLVPDEAARAWEWLRADGFVPQAPQGGVLPDRHHHLPPLARRHDGQALVVELHRALATVGGARRLAAAEVVTRAVRVRLGGASVFTLSSDDALAHLALHHPGELAARRVVDLLLASRRHRSAGLARARRLIDPGWRWQLDLVAGIASHLLGDDGLLAAIPLPRRALLSLACVPDWGQAHLVAAWADEGRERGLAGPVAEPWLAARDRLTEVIAATLPVALREPRRRLFAAARLLRERFGSEPPGEGRPPP